MTTKTTRQQARRNKRAYEQAKIQAEPDGMVCGFLDKDGTPHYFTMAKDADEVDVRARAFESIHGRPMNRAELLLDAAVAGDFVKAYEQAMTHYLDRSEDGSSAD